MSRPIRILQRPFNAQVDNSEEKSTILAPIKTREQREAEYAAARLRILGSEKPENDTQEITTTLIKSSTVLGLYDSNSDNGLADSSVQSENDPNSTSEQVEPNCNKIPIPEPETNVKHAVTAKKQLPPSLMSIKTDPTCLDSLNVMKVLNQGLLSTPPITNIDTDQLFYNSKNSRACATRNSQPFICHKGQGNLRAVRHSDTSLYSRQYSRTLPAGPCMQQSALPQGQLSNWDARPWSPVSMGGGLLLGNNTNSRMVPRTYQAGTLNTMPRVDNEAAMIAMFAAASNVPDVPQQSFGTFNNSGSSLIVQGNGIMPINPNCEAVLTSNNGLVNMLPNHANVNNAMFQPQQYNMYCAKNAFGIGNAGNDQGAWRQFRSGTVGASSNQHMICSQLSVPQQQQQQYAMLHQGRLSLQNGMSINGASCPMTGFLATDQSGIDPNR